MLKEQLLIQPLLRADPDAYSAREQEYFHHYGLKPQGNVLHLFGSFESGNCTLAGHLFIPPEYKGVVLGLHGYLNHCGQLKNLIRFLLNCRYAIGVFDLPGHGLSGGEKARMDSMDEYVQAANDFMEIAGQQVHGPFHAAGFSTGAAILLDMLMTGRAEKIDKIILAAPLIRWTLYEQSKGTYKVYSRFTDKISRFYRKNSSDPEFLAFTKTQDYLHADHLSLYWVKAMFQWNEKIETLPPADKKAMIIQGNKDTTVDWRYNLKLLSKKLPAAKVITIPGARHELFNEAEQFRRIVFGSAVDYLENNVEENHPL